MAEVIDAHLKAHPDPSAAATLAESRKAAQRVLGPGLQSADDLSKVLATTTLELADLFEVLP
jgi:hypothetical protein